MYSGPERAQFTTDLNVHTALKWLRGAKILQ